MNSASENDASA